MKVEDIKMDLIYVGDGDMEGVPGYLYIRGFKDGQIGFSVLDDPVRYPDFSNSGIFWMAPDVFASVAKPYAG